MRGVALASLAAMLAWSAWVVFGPGPDGGRIAAGPLAGTLPVPPGTTLVRPATTVRVRPGMSVEEIGHLLESRGVIRSPWIFTLLASARGAEAGLQAGTYTFRSSTSLWSAMEALIRGRVSTTTVLIPEALRLEEIAERLSAALPFSRDDLLAAAQDPMLLDSLGIAAPSPEGYLFPDTYAFPCDATPREVVRTLIGRFREVARGIGLEREGPGRLSPREIVILASIIEKEAKRGEERPVISAVFHRRLALGRALEADPTVRYALGKFAGPLGQEDLAVDSPYNTYRSPGLPPGPICSPGRASLEAALHPAECDYLYFVAAGDGSHIFSRTLEEHAAARAAAGHTGESKAPRPR